MKLVDQKILVTGGAGFIGGHFVHSISPKNRVVVYDNFTSNVFSLDDLRKIKNVNVIRGDILNATKLDSAMDGVTTVFHFAAAHIRLSLTQERFVHDVNATGTLQTLLAAKKHGIKRFIHISSSEAYGSAKTPKIREDHPMDPVTVYGMSKYHGELYAKYFNDHEGVPSIIIRPFNTYGPYCHFNGVYGEVIPRFVIRALSGRAPIIFGNGHQTRDFTYISDTVTGIRNAAISDKLLGATVNIAFGKEVSILELARIISKQTGLGVPPIIKPARPHDVSRHFADIAKAKKILAWKPKIHIQEGLERYILWVKKSYPDPKKLINMIPDTNW